MKKKICIITGTRAEWGLFFPLAGELKKRKEIFDLKIIATGAHLSREHGQTWREIEKDGFNITRKVEMLVPGDGEDANIRSVSSGISGTLEALQEIRPDAVCLLGDRYETFAAAVAAFMLKIPIAHIHGGEVTEGAMDDVFRHSITKMANVHFVSTDVYAKRVVQMGEVPSRVFNVGALGIDNIMHEEFMDKKEVERKIGMVFGEKNVLVTYHPVTLEDRENSDSAFKELLDVLDELRDAKIIFTRPNADIYSGNINERIDAFVKDNADRAVCVTSLGRVLYLSAVRFMDVVVGNSSSGIIEVPALGVPVVNIGDRQKGRVRSLAVIDAAPEGDMIKKAFEKAFSNDFKEACASGENPYGDGAAAVKIADILGKVDLSDVKKSFYDVEFDYK